MVPLFEFFDDKTFCELFVKKRPEHVLKALRSLSLRYSADFRRSRLVFQIDGFTKL